MGGKLAETHPRSLVNSFKEGGENEQFWGVVQGKGSNTLGKILMTVREEIRNGSDWPRWIADQGIEPQEKMRPAVSLIVIKDDKPIDKLFLEKKNKFFFGSQQFNEFKLEHQSISKTHACIFFGHGLNVMLVDLGSSNGTTVTRGGETLKLEPLKPLPLQKDDIITFGLSSRKYRVEIDRTGAENYLKSQRTKTEEAAKRDKAEEAKRSKEERKASRSRSRSPRHKKNRN